MLSRLEAAELPARWFTFVLRCSSGLNQKALHELDESISGWLLHVQEDRFRRELRALVRWLHDELEAAQRSRPARSVNILPPDEHGQACLQVIGPAPEILALERRSDSAARAVQRRQRQALESGAEVPFDDGTVAESATPLPLADLRYLLLRGSVLETGAVEVPPERFRITVTVPALSLLGAVDSPDMLEHLRLRNPTCALPTCTPPTSWASEMDHIEEFNHREPAAGGPTSIENTHLLYWRHHQLKTAGLSDPVRVSPCATDPPGTFRPGVTSWTIRGSRPVDAIDNTDMVTPWVVDAFTQMQDYMQQRIKRHQAAPAGTGTERGTPGRSEDSAQKADQRYGSPPY